MRAVLFSFTYKGSRLSVTLGELLRRQGYTVQAYAMPKYCDFAELQPLVPDLQTLSAQAFAEAKLLVYIGATGIAVRTIAPFVKDKKSDPAVICLDELGKFTIPLLSGHIGGANRLAEYLAQAINSTPVITTATDLNNLPAIDEWATRNNLYITDMHMAKQIAAGLLDGAQIGISSSYELPDNLPAGFVQRTDTQMGVVIADNTDTSPYQHTLFLLPKNIHLGIGCRRGIQVEAIEQLVLNKLQELNIAIGRVATVASIDLKAQESGLLEFIKKYQLTSSFYTAAQLQQVAGEFSSSNFVQTITGVNNVCERAAVLSSGGKILQHKCSNNGVTLAVAVEK